MKTKSLDTPTIDEILANICDQICSPDKLCEYCCEAKQALLQWRDAKVLEVIKSYEYVLPSSDDADNYDRVDLLDVLQDIQDNNYTQRAKLGGE